MIETGRVAALIKEARTRSADSLESLADAEKHWDRRELLRSAEQAWSATTQATNALILAHCEVEPEFEGASDTYGMLSRLAREIPELQGLKEKYTEFSVFLFDSVICNGNPDPLEITVEDIRKTAEYIRECERLARRAA